MPEYVLIDGPLAGHSLGSSEVHAAGDTLAIEVVDIAQSPDEIPRYDYFVESGPGETQPGRLRHAAS